MASRGFLAQYDFMQRSGSERSALAGPRPALKEVEGEIIFIKQSYANQNIEASQRITAGITFARLVQGENPSLGIRLLIRRQTIEGYHVVKGFAQRITQQAERAREESFGF